jgi:hypothetical protein
MRLRLPGPVPASLLLVMAILMQSPARATPPPTGQPSDEAAAQKILPKVHDPLWSALGKCDVGYDEKNGVYSIKVTPEVKTLDGKKLTVRGFVLPMDGSDRTRHFLITRNTPVCLFCPPGQPNEVIEVRSSSAVPWTDKIAAITGTFNLIDDGEKALFFRIENAEVKQ